MAKNTIVNDTVRITVITLVAGLCLGLVNQVTLEPIAQQEALKKTAACQAVFADADDFSEAIDLEAVGITGILEDAGLAGDADVNEALVAKANGEPVGYVITVTDHKGYGGDINFTVGLRNDGTINGISLISINETAGLGMKAKTTDWADQFMGMAIPQDGLLEYTKTGEEGKVDAISAATITTKAITGGTNAAIALYKSLNQ